MTDSSSFPFIVSNGPRVPKDPAVRTLIRKQAMRDVGMARKKKGSYGRVNMRQYPAYEATTDPIRSATDGFRADSNDSRVSLGSDSDSTLQGDTDELELERLDGDAVVPFNRLVAEQIVTYNSLSLPTLSPNPDYERVRNKFGLDLTDLSILTNFNVGKSTIAILSADPSRLASLLGQQQWSYLEYVPGRYGRSECLTAATNVLLAKAHLVLAPREDQGHALCSRLYGKALRSLQDALTDESKALSADVLCATQLLSLHEVGHFEPRTGSAHAQLLTLNPSSSILRKTQLGRIIYTDPPAWSNIALLLVSRASSKRPCLQPMLALLYLSLWCMFFFGKQTWNMC